MNGKPINWYHNWFDNEKRTLGTFEDANYKENQLTGRLDISDPKYTTWIHELQDKNIIPQVSPEFFNKEKAIVDVDDGFIEICFDVEFQGIALTENAICSPEAGCGIRNFSEEVMTENTDLADTFWLDYCDMLAKEYNLDFEKMMAVWTTAYVNDLPDSAFAVIMPGGEKDKEGKTTPRSLRKLPYKDGNGKVDVAHLRNALARAPQMKGVSADQKARAITHLKSVAKKFLPTYKESSEDKKMSEEEENKSPCEESKELSEKIETLIDEKLAPVLEIEKKLSTFLEKFESPKEEDKKKELSTEEIVKQTVQGYMEREAILKNLSGAGITGVENLPLEALKEIKIEQKSTEAKVPKNAPRKTVFVDEEGEEKNLSELSDRQKDIISANVFRKTVNGAPFPTQKALAHRTPDELPEGWFGDVITDEVSS